MTTALRWARRLLAAGLVALTSLSCVERGDLSQDTFRLKVGLTLQNGSPLPGPDSPLPLDLRGLNKENPNGQFFKLTVEALLPDGTRDASFNRYVRVSVLPGTIQGINPPPPGQGAGSAVGRNVLLAGGYAEGQTVHVVGAFGPTRLIVEDLGYQPGDPTNPAVPPLCADGKDNDGDGLTDFPADPGCAFSNDDTEDLGSYASGSSPSIEFALPTVAEAQGFSNGTPFAQEGIVVETKAPRANLIVARVSNNGFYVTDVDIGQDESGNQTLKAKDYGSLYVFNFGLPAGVQVCDRVTYLSGTMDEFFGYSEMTFPSYDVDPFYLPSGDTTTDTGCLLPEPFLITADAASDDATLEKVEAGLVRVRGAHVAKYLGPDYPRTEPFDFSSNYPCQPPPDFYNKFVFEAGASNCDLDRSGSIDFSPGSRENLCACFCYQNPDCSEWTAYRGRGSFRVVLGGKPENTIQANTSAINDFNPVAAAGHTVGSLTGTVANFSGGRLNWTIEARCSDDLVACPPPADDSPEAIVAADEACAASPPEGKPSSQACIGKRTIDDNDASN